jgi:hypothetical protein
MSEIVGFYSIGNDDAKTVYLENITTIYEKIKTKTLTQPLPPA